MDKAQQTINQSRSNQQDTNALTSQEELQTSSIDLISADGAQYTPRHMLMLQRTLGNQATMQVVNRRTPKTTLPSGFTQRTPLIQRDDDVDNGGSGPIQDKQAQQEEEAEQPQDDPEAAEQEAELNTIPPEAAEIEAIASSAKSEEEEPVKEVNGLNDYADDMTVTDGSQIAPDNAVPVDDDTDDDSSSNNGGVSQVSVSQSSPKTNIKGNKPKGNGNQAFVPNRIGGGGLVGNILQGGVATGKAAGVGIDATTASYLIKEGGWLKSAAPGDMETANDGSGSEVIDKLSSVGEYLNAPPLNILLPVPTLVQRIYGAYMKYKHYKAFKELADASGGIDKASLKTKTMSNAKVSTYGYYKTKRGFWTRFVKAAMTLGQIIARVVTLASGLTSSLATEGADLALALVQGIMKLTESLKGALKIIFNKRGKHRAMIANAIVDKAFAGDQDMLKFMVDSEALSKGWFAKINAATKSGIGEWFASLGIDIKSVSMIDQATLTTRPKDTQQMAEYLKTSHRLGMLQKLSAEVSTVMKST